MPKYNLYHYINGKLIVTLGYTLTSKSYSIVSGLFMVTALIGKVT